MELLTGEWLLLFGKQPDVWTPGCWLYEGTTDRDGYGVKTYLGRQWRVPRLSFMLAFGKDPEEAHVRHTCDTPGCFRPSHLIPGTNLENVADRVERGRTRNQHTQAESCDRGHDLTPENTYTNPGSGRRRCRICRRLEPSRNRGGALV